MTIVQYVARTGLYRAVDQIEESGAAPDLAATALAAGLEQPRPAHVPAGPVGRRSRCSWWRWLLLLVGSCAAAAVDLRHAKRCASWAASLPTAWS
ncbi:MAG: hypothetical protein V9H69_16605 [Anaerolineae bacterium]